jgi:DNA-directed RNA polymerase I, II, and III subunit RPABC2
MNIYLTKYEKARVLGIRALQLSNGAVPMVNVGNLKNVNDIAEKELFEYKIPIIIKRKFPDGSSVSLKVSEMILE